MSFRSRQGGFDFKLTHKPTQEIYDLAKPETVALAPVSVRGFKPRVVVKVGDRVSCGQELAHHKLDARIQLTSPAGGIVREVRYGPRRSLIAIVVEIEPQEASINFGKMNESEIDNMSDEMCRQKLREMGLWVRFGVFPNRSMAPLDPDIKISGIHVSTFSTEPYHASGQAQLLGQELIASVGLRVLSRLSSNVKLFRSGDFKGLDAASLSGAYPEEIGGYYPSHQAGVQAWQAKEKISEGALLEVSLQLLLDIGFAFINGRLNMNRLYAVGGDGVSKKAHYRGRVGMRVQDVIAGANEVQDPTIGNRYIAGGLLTGTKVSREDFVGLNHDAVCVMPEDKKRIPFSFFRPGFDKLTSNRTWVSGFSKSALRNPTTNNNGEERPCIQCGDCVTRCPVGLFPNLIMKASKAQDIEELERLSVFDCTDCGLCTFVCPSKIELGKSIVSGKNLIVREG